MCLRPSCSTSLTRVLPSLISSTVNASHLGWAVVEGDAVTQLLAGAALDNAVNRGEVRLRNLERRVHQAVSQVRRRW